MTTADATMPGLVRVKRRFLEKLNEREQRLTKAIEIARTSLSRRERVAALFECQEILHKLAGVAGTVGLHDVGEGAHYCEVAIRDHLDTGNTSADRVSELLDMFMLGLASMAER